MEVTRTERSGAQGEFIVDELVLHGVESKDALQIAEAMRLELERLIAAEPGIAARIARGGGADRSAPPLRVDHDARPADLGTLLARAVLREVVT